MIKNIQTFWVPWMLPEKINITSNRFFGTKMGVPFTDYRTFQLKGALNGSVSGCDQFTIPLGVEKWHPDWKVLVYTSGVMGPHINDLING